MLVVVMVTGCGGGPALPEIADGSADIEGVTRPYIVDDDRFLPRTLNAEIVAPESGGPWPVVVMFHGNGGNPDDLRAEARKVAARGRVVFNVAWQRVVATDDIPSVLDLYSRQAACAVSFARAVAADYGGDPSHVTLFGFSGGGNAAAVVAFADPEPLDTCAAVSDGPVSALVIVDGALLLASDGWDGAFEEDPDTFYAFTPWRLLDDGTDIPIHLLATDSSGLGRSLEDPEWMTTRHTDIDLRASLGADTLADGFVSLPEILAWARDQFAAAGYDTSLTDLPDSTHMGWSRDAREVIWDTVVRAEER